MPDQHEDNSLLRIVQKSKVHSVSLIGMAKNVGKTVAFNHLVRHAADHGLLLGLTSIGRDGENRDEVFYTPKPRIFAPAGALLATARGTLKKCEMCTELLHATGFPTAMGEIVVVRACEAGFVELAGPTRITQHQVLQNILKDYGANLTLIDGALDRISPAVPALAQATILSTGAALGSSMEVVLEKTKDRISRLTLPTVSEAQRSILQQLTETCKAAIIDDEQQVTVLPIDNSLLAGELLLQSVTSKTKTVVLAGAVGDRVLESLLSSKKRGNVQLVIRNGTTLFGATSLWRRFVAAGGSIRVVEPINLLAVTVNPISPTGAKFNPHTFLECSASALAPFPVFDVMLGRSAGGQRAGG